MFFGGGVFNSQAGNRNYERQRQEQHYNRRTTNNRQQQEPSMHRSSTRNRDGTDPENATFRQLGPLLIVIMITFLTSFGSNSTQGGHLQDFKFSFEQSYAHPHKVISGHLHQIYYVNQQAMFEFNQRGAAKVKHDLQVEEEVIRRLDKKCNEAKR